MIKLIERNACGFKKLTDGKLTTLCESEKINKCKTVISKNLIYWRQSKINSRIVFFRKARDTNIHPKSFWEFDFAYLVYKSTNVKKIFFNFFSNLGWFIYWNVRNQILRNFYKECWCPLPFQKKLFEKNRTFKKIQKFEVS